METALTYFPTVLTASPDSNLVTANLNTKKIDVNTMEPDVKLSFDLMIVFGVLDFLVGIGPMIVRMIAISSMPLFGTTSVWGITYELVWIFQLILWGLASLFWPFTYLPDAREYSRFYLNYFSHGTNWAGSIVGGILFILLIVSWATENSTTPIIYTCVYGVGMAALLTFTWIYYENGVYPRFLDWFHNMSHYLTYNDSNSIFVSNGELFVAFNGDNRYFNMTGKRVSQIDKRGYVSFDEFSRATLNKDEVVEVNDKIYLDITGKPVVTIKSKLYVAIDAFPEVIYDKNKRSYMKVSDMTIVGYKGKDSVKFDQDYLPVIRFNQVPYVEIESIPTMYEEGRIWALMNQKKVSTMSIDDDYFAKWEGDLLKINYMPIGEAWDTPFSDFADFLARLYVVGI